LHEYEELAVTLGNDPQRVQALKKKLENNKLTTPLFDSDLFTSKFECVLEKIYSDESNH